MIFDFKCPDGHQFEAWVKPDVRTQPCRTCGKDSQRLISAPSVHLDPTSGHFPGATLKWAKDHERGARKNAE